MKNLYYSTLFFCSIASQLSLAQRTVSTAGGNISGANGNVSYTLGQMTYTTNLGANGSMSQGVQQPFEIQTILGEAIFNINLQLAIYPNPTSNWLNLTIKNTEFSKLSYQLLDLNGKIIFTEKISSGISSIQMERLPSAIYILKVIDSNKELKTFRIIKN
jgi:hypothetical protein